MPGPRVGGELGGVLRAGHHRGRPGTDVDAVRALHQQGAQRAARHRRRLRAPAARGGHPVHLRQVRPPPRRARRDADHLPAEERRARRRQGAGARPRAGRPPDRRVRVVGRPRGEARAHPRGRLRARRAGDPPAGDTGQPAAGLPAPPVAARRRLRHRPRPARTDGAGGKRGDGRANGDPVGQGRPRRHGPAQGRLPGAGHALRDPPRARPGSRKWGQVQFPCRRVPIPTKGKGN